MTVSLQRLDQLHKPDAYNDARSAASIAGSEAADLDFADAYDAMLSQVKRIIYGGEVGNWYDDPELVGPAGKTDATLYELVRRARLEDKDILTYRLNLNDITVPAAQNWVAISAAGSLPAHNIAIVNTTQGAVVAQLAGAIGSHSLSENSGLNALKPKNLIQIFDGATGAVLQSGGRDVYGLLQVGSAATDGNAFATSGNDQPQISFVRPTSTYDDLEAVPVADIENAVIVYGYSCRDDLVDTPEEAFRGDLETAQGVAGGVSLDLAYDGGYFMVVDGNDVDIRLADTKSWVFRSGTGSGLMAITRDDTTGDEVGISSAVERFDCDAADNDFSAGVKAATGSQTINIGVTAGGVIDSASAELRANTGDATIRSTNQDVQFQTVRETTPIPLDDATAGAISALTGGPHASIAAAIKYAIDAGGIAFVLKVSISGANYNQGVNIPNITHDLTAYTLDMNTPANTDMLLFLNGRLLYGGNATTKNDVYAGDTPANGDIKVDFPRGIKSGDVFISVGLQ